MAAIYINDANELRKNGKEYKTYLQRNFKTLLYLIQHD